MEEATEIITRSSNVKQPKHSGESRIGGLSIRALITLSLVWTVAYMSVAGLKVEEPLYTLVGMVAAYYFGQNVRNQNGHTQPIETSTVKN